jgi:hypothetical protein
MLTICLSSAKNSLRFWWRCVGAAGHWSQMKISSVESSAPPNDVSASIKNLVPASERCSVIFTFWIALRQWLIAVNVNEEQLVQFCKHAVIGIGSTRQDPGRIHKPFFLKLPTAAGLCTRLKDPLPKYRFGRLPAPPLPECPSHRQ